MKIENNDNDLIAKLTKDKKSEILIILSELVLESDKKKNKLHEVFETSFDCKILDNDEFIELKLNYIHNNPVKGPNLIVEKCFEYIHSSSAFYLGIGNKNYPVQSVYDMDGVEFE